MTALREAAGYAQAHLYDVLKHTDAMDSAADRRTAIQALCAESEADLTRATQELKTTEELARVTTDLKKQTSILNDLRDRSNQDLDEKIKAAQGEWAGLEARIEKTKREIKEVEASTESLVRRLRVG
jgi:chromosome segregation ATPase